MDSFTFLNVSFFDVRLVLLHGKVEDYMETARQRRAPIPAGKAERPLTTNADAGLILGCRTGLGRMQPSNRLVTEP